MNIQAVEDKIIVYQMNRTQTKGGIIIPNTVKTEPQMFGKVVSCGELVKNIKPGDIIMFHQKAGMAVILQNYIYLVVKYTDVYAIIDDPQLFSELTEVRIGE